MSSVLEDNEAAIRYVVAAVLMSFDGKHPESSRSHHDWDSIVAKHIPVVLMEAIASDAIGSDARCPEHVSDRFSACRVIDGSAEHDVDEIVGCLLRIVGQRNHKAP
jgi:hypothetical protein